MNEVIIDGVNVAECNDIYGKEWINPQCLDGGGLCKKYPNCYFKQLQRAKADIEELKEFNDSYDEDVRALLEDIDKLKAEKQDLINYYELREGGMQEDIQYWKNKAQEQYRELEQYKASKQASYESMQVEWNNAVNELRELKASYKIEFKQFYKAENERLQAENGKLKKEVKEIRTWEELKLSKYRKALEEVRELGEKTDSMKLIEIVDEVLK